MLIRNLVLTIEPAVDTGGVHDRKIGCDQHGNDIYADASGHRRTYCKACGIALDVGGGCSSCKPLKEGR